MSRSGLKKSAGRAALTFALLASAGSLAEAGTIRIGHTTWVGYGPMYLARDLGYFKDAGLDVDLQVIEDSSLYMAAAAAGKLDGSMSTIDEIMKYRSEEFCFKAVYTLDDSFGVEEYHHFCLTVADVDATLTELRSRGVEVLGDALDLEAIGRRLGFLKDNNDNVIELASPLR